MQVFIALMAAALAAPQDVPPLEFDDVAYRYPVQKVEIGGVSTAYIDEGRGPAVLFLHGNGSDLSVFDGIYPDLVESHRVLALDLPGFGKSEKPELEFGAEWYANHAARLLESLGVERCIVVGHSFGGLVALALALGHPERVAGLVLAASPGAYRYPDLQASYMRNTFTPERTRASTAEQIRAGMQFALGQWREEYEAWVRKRAALNRSKDAAAYAHAGYRALIATLDTRLEDRLGEIETPALVIWGGRDPVVPPQAGTNLKEALPDARLKMIDEAAHFPMLTHRSQFLEALRSFLREVSP